MLKKALYKHTKYFLEKNLPENFFLFKKSNKKRKKSFNLKAAFVKTNLYKLKKNYRHLPVQDSAPLKSLNQPLNSNISKLYTKYFLNDKFLFSLSTIKNIFEKRQTRSSDFKNKLKEKKKLSLLYGNLSDKSIKKALFAAKKLSGNVNENLLLVLETRLDIVLYRALFFSSISSAKQYIKKNKLKVNSSFINTPSYSIKYGDIISVPKKNRKQVYNNMIKYFIKYNVITQNSNKDLYYNNDFLAFKQLKTVSLNKDSMYGLKKNNLRVNKLIRLPAKSLEKNVPANKQISHLPIFNYDLVQNVYKNLLLLKINLKQNLHSYKILCNTQSNQEAKNSNVAGQGRFQSFFETSLEAFKKSSSPQKQENLPDPQLKVAAKRRSSFISSISPIQSFFSIKVPFFSKKLVYLRKIIQLVKMLPANQKQVLKPDLGTKTQPYNNFLQNTSLVEKMNSELLARALKERFTVVCNLHFYKTSINGKQAGFKTCPPEKLNMYKFLDFFRKIHMCNDLIQYINNMYFCNHANGFVLKKILYLKKAFKQKHRYIIPNLYITFLKNQIKLSNVFLLKKYIDILAKKFLLEKITKVKNIKKNISNLGNFIYKNKIDNQFEILLSKINSSNLNTFKSIFNSLLNDSKSDKKLVYAKTKIIDLKYLNFLFFLKINSLFLKKRLFAAKVENNNLINIKPLNLEICYKTLTIIYLYQTQKLVFPCSLDVELLIRYYG
jgi:ribosomal protein S4